MAELTGGFSFNSQAVGGPEMSFALEPVRQFYKDLSILKEDMTVNQHNVYSFLDVGRYGRAYVTGLTAPRHVLQGGTNCKTWNPKGSAYTTVDKVETMKLELNMEQCYDSIAGDCFQALLSTGTDMTDLFSNPEISTLMQMLVDGVFTGINNSIYDLAWYSRHPQIASANSNDTWDTSVITLEEWADFYDQQFASDDNGKQLKGFATLIDEEKAAGISHFNNSFVDGDFSDSTGAYTGSDIQAEFEAVKRAAHPNLRPIINRRRGGPGAVYLVSQSVFDAYKDSLIDTYNGIPEGYMMRVEGELVPGVLMYDGIPVVVMDEWRMFDDMLNIYTHRIVLTAIGNLGIAHDVTPIAQRSGAGMIFQQSPVLKDKGRIDMYANFRLGAFIADTNLMVNKSLVETKA